MAIFNAVFKCLLYNSFDTLLSFHIVYFFFYFLEKIDLCFYTKSNKPCLVINFFTFLNKSFTFFS